VADTDGADAAPEMTDEEILGGAEMKNMRKSSELRLGIRNTFNIPPIRHAS
jgi:hypothetical protein